MQLCIFVTCSETDMYWERTWDIRWIACS